MTTVNFAEAPAPCTQAHFLLAGATYQPADFGLTMAGRANNELVPAYTRPTLATPQAIDYQWPAWSRELFLWFRTTRSPLYVTGPTGAGKTEAVKQLAAAFNLPVYEVNGHGRLEFAELVGHFSLVRGETVWQDGPLTSAMRWGGVFLLNEIDLLDPSTATGLNTILDGSPLTIAETVEVVRPHPGYMFVATANTAGNGEGSGLYQGTLRMNAAFLDRFSTLVADYLPEHVERGLLGRKFPNLPSPALDAICKMASLIRAEFTETQTDTTYVTSGLEVPMSTRTVLRWAQWAMAMQPMASKYPNLLEAAMMVAFGNRLDSAQQLVLRELLQRVTGDALGTTN